ncbi:hypothetical protein L7F22_029227 [Adiantum nelumboides]|nr:hypothetical protein [Adiantum nelumboides]
MPHSQTVYDRDGPEAVWEIPYRGLMHQRAETPPEQCRERYISDYYYTVLLRNRPSSSSLFPEPGSTWKAFKEIQKLISKTHGKTVEEVMTPSPLVVQETSNFEDAARLLLETQKRRLPVVDVDGKLVGLLSRGNVIKAALCLKQEFEMGGEKE